MLNEVTLLGHLGADPEIRRTQDGRPVANLRIATSESWKDKESGERRERTEWHNVVCFNEGLCGVIEKHLKKGSKILVKGSLQTRKWQDQKGDDRYTTEVVMKNFDAKMLMLDTQSNRPPAAQSEDDYGKTSTRSNGAAAGEEMQRQGGKSQRSFDEELNDEIPFALKLPWQIEAPWQP